MSSGLRNNCMAKKKKKNKNSKYVDKKESLEGWGSHGVKSIWQETKSDDQIRYKDLLPPNDT